MYKYISSWASILKFQGHIYFFLESYAVISVKVTSSPKVFPNSINFTEIYKQFYLIRYVCFVFVDWSCVPREFSFLIPPVFLLPRMAHVHNPLATADICSSLQYTVRQLQLQILIHVKLKLGARPWFASRNGERRRLGKLTDGWSGPPLNQTESPLQASRLSWARWCNSSLWQQSRSVTSSFRLRHI